MLSGGNTFRMRERLPDGVLYACEPCPGGATLLADIAHEARDVKFSLGAVYLRCLLSADDTVNKYL